MNVALRLRALLAAKWIATATGITGAVLIALNIGLVAHGFALFLASSLLWCAAAIVQREPSLVVMQGAFVAIKGLGLWRWLGS